MSTLSIDIETYSGTDLKTAGVYRYVEDPDFAVLLFAYAFDHEPGQIIDLASGENLPEEVYSALLDPYYTKSAFNANFERVCLGRHLGLPLQPQQWRCTRVHALTMGLPSSLDLVAKALKMEAQKDAAGKALIRYFSMPCRPTKTNGGRTRNLPKHNSEKWEQFKAYCIQDVLVEREIRNRLARYPVPETEWKLYVLDQIINDNGVKVDRVLVDHAITCDALHQDRLKKEAITLTSLVNPNSLPQLKRWLEDKTGEKVESLTKDTMPVLLEQAEDKLVARVLAIRQEMAKTSVKKYAAMSAAACRDDRVRGILQFYGANRTGRWAGRILQPQNLPRSDLADLALARELLRSGDYEGLELLFGTPNALSQLIRSALIPADGHRFLVVDFSAIEARVIAWLAGEKWRLDVFESHGEIYEASASQMFRTPIEEIGKRSPLRQKGKVAELALGYQGGPRALTQMGALKTGLTEEELPDLVAAWRATNPRIVQFWWDIETAALEAVQDKRTITLQHNLKLFCEPGVLFVELPSGRRLAYIRPTIETEKKFNKLGLTYEGYELGKWGRLRTYGGKLTENVVQAIARDCLAEALLGVDAVGYKIVLHVHDEIVVEAPGVQGSIEELIDILSRPLSWAPGLPLAADGFETKYYTKE